jgi:hypothetical protein
MSSDPLLLKSKGSNDSVEHIQGTFGIIQGTFGIIQGTFGIIQGTFGIRVEHSSERRDQMMDWVLGYGTVFPPD